MKLGTFSDFSVSLDTEWIPLEAPRGRSGTLGGDEQKAQWCHVPAVAFFGSADRFTVLIIWAHWRHAPVPYLQLSLGLIPSHYALWDPARRCKRKMITWPHIKQEASFSMAFPEQVPEPGAALIISFRHSFLPKVWQLIRSEWTNIEVALFCMLKYLFGTRHKVPFITSLHTQWNS